MLSGQEKVALLLKKFCTSQKVLIDLFKHLNDVNLHACMQTNFDAACCQRKSFDGNYN